ncbi:Zn-ribbon domain-containing OB-fold protein [Hydrogenophaga sp. BPS33]|uniref:Zn-ribbon domain-containing OB-fold protein n=1 Tax=Hydrogenophaga sp. BPS33 TaxID=2651974 RepID=UPI00131FD036|nr:OB-fold domain-containing protein [Hydrogenophaga sp. BPS33]QHE85712.1 hypothetical protein F9K07_12770 [Hydrogenophaga sp. BPS33]
MQLTQREAPYMRETADGVVLMAARARRGADLQFPPPAFVHGPSDAADLADVEIGPQGLLYTYSIVHPGRDKPPYGLAMVDFEPGVRVFGRLLVEPGSEPELGALVKVVPFALQDGTPDYAFEPLPGATHA